MLRMCMFKFIFSMIYSPVFNICYIMNESMKFDLYSAFLETQGRFTITFLHTAPTPERSGSQSHTLNWEQPSTWRTASGTTTLYPGRSANPYLGTLTHTQTYIHAPYPCFWSVGGNRSPWRKPTQTRGEHGNSAQIGT
ncbi:hypothetical protein MHYP_G00103950 [Metynnis hypsauchen]